MDFSDLSMVNHVTIEKQTVKLLNIFEPGYLLKKIFFKDLNQYGQTRSLIKPNNP